MRMGVDTESGCRAWRHARLAVAAGLWLAIGTASAGTLQVTVSGQGKPATDAVVSLHSPVAAAAIHLVPWVMD